MTKPVVIVGAGNHGRSVADILDSVEATNKVAGYLDDSKSAGEIVLGYPVLGGFSAMRDLALVRDHAWFVAVGDNRIRSDLCRALADAGARFVSVIHPSAQISRRATLGRALYVGGCASVQVGSVIGDWAHLSSNTLVGPDGRLGEGAYIGPSSVLSAGTSVGARSFLGAGTILSNDASVRADCVVGANSLVRGDLPDGTTAYGVPARPAPLNRKPFRR